MSDHLESLERLARLRAEGTLTDDEFQAEKAKLLAGTATSRRGKSLAEGWEESREARRQFNANLKWLWIALLIGFPIVIGVMWWRISQMTPEESAQAVADGLPQCASSEIKASLRDAIENGPASNLIAIKVLEIANIVDRGTGGSPTMLYCAADITTNGGTEHIGYTIRYSNEETGAFLIETGEDTGPSSDVQSGQDGTATPGALAATNEWLVGKWAFSDICATGDMISFNSDGTYTIPRIEEGLYSSDGKTVKFYQGRSLPEMGEDDAGFVPQAIDDQILPVKPLTENSMMLDGQVTTRC